MKPRSPREVYTGLGFRGYLPDTAEVYQMLEGRRTSAFIQGMELRSEQRWAARFASQPDLSITLMVAQMHRRGPKIKEMLTAWGIDWRSRRVMTREEMVEQGIVAGGKSGQQSLSQAA